MIRQEYRFHGYGSLNYLFRNGQRSHSKLFGLRFVRNSRRQKPRIAVIVSKKIFKSAVKRNRIRRRVYEVVRQNFDFHKSFDFALTVLSPEVLDLPQPKLAAEISQLLSEIK